jgi:6-phosphofructokinase
VKRIGILTRGGDGPGLDAAILAVVRNALGLSACDIPATRFGAAAVDLADAGAWDRMVSLRGPEITDVALADAATVRPVREELSRVAGVFFRGETR